MEKENNLIQEQESAAIEDDTCASSSESIVRRTTGKTTYVASLHFKEQGQSFSQKLRRVLKADTNKT